MNISDSLTFKQKNSEYYVLSWPQTKLSLSEGNLNMVEKHQRDAKKRERNENG